jgi:non-ribosomal peptide synthetase component F
MTYAEWGAAERAFWQPAEIDNRADFWRKHLKDTVRLWDRPTDVNARVGKLRRWITAMPADLATSVRELSKRSGATLFNTLLTAFQMTLAEWTGKEDIVVGSPVANRSRQAAKETMGYFAGVVPLRGKVIPDEPFAQAVRRVQQQSMDAFANAMPFVEIARAAGAILEPGHNPIFDVRFALQNHPIPDVVLPNLSVKLRMRSTGTARFDLACEVTEDGAELEVVWLFRESLFSAAEIKDLDCRYQTLLTNVSHHPGKTAAAVPAWTGA